MKKLLFALEVLFLLSALPVFSGLALHRKHHVSAGAGNNVSTPLSQEGGAAGLVYPGAAKNSRRLVLHRYGGIHSKKNILFYLRHY